MQASKIINLAVLLVIALACLQVYANGKGLVTSEYHGSYIDEDAIFSLGFQTQIDPIQFLLHRVHNKYKIVRIEVKDRGQKEVKLSAKQDKIEFYFTDGQKISGILDLAEHDPNYWDNLDEELRKTLAYPKSTAPTTIKGTNNIYVFLPAKKTEALRKSEKQLDILPTLIRYKIASLRPEGFTIKRQTIKSKK